MVGIFFSGGGLESKHHYHFLPVFMFTVIGKVNAQTRQCSCHHNSIWPWPGLFKAVQCLLLDSVHFLFHMCFVFLMVKQGIGPLLYRLSVAENHV